MSATTERFRGRAGRRLREHSKSVAAMTATLVVGLIGLMAATVVASDQNRQLPRTNDQANEAQEPGDSLARQLAGAKAELLEANQAKRTAQVQAEEALQDAKRARSPAVRSISRL